VPVVPLRMVDGGMCRIINSNTFGGVWEPNQLPALGFTIGPSSVMADQKHASTKDQGAMRTSSSPSIWGRRRLRTATTSCYGLGIVTVNADGKSGTFALNDGSASGDWDCGHTPQR
jgi:hypothetical protein